MGKILGISILLIMLAFVVLGTFMIGKSSKPDSLLLALSDVPPPTPLVTPASAEPAEPMAEVPESDAEAGIRTPSAVQPDESFEENDELTAPPSPEPPAAPEPEPLAALAVGTASDPSSAASAEPDAEAAMVTSPAPASTDDGGATIEGRLVKPVEVKWFHIPGTRIRVGATPRE